MGRWPVSAGHRWLEHFLQHSLGKFGDYQDVISRSEPFLFHSVLTPAPNIGLLTPGEVVAKTLADSREQNILLNRLEGFLRQVIGWREFMRAGYLLEEKSCAPRISGVIMDSFPLRCTAARRIWSPWMRSSGGLTDTPMLTTPRPDHPWQFHAPRGNRPGRGLPHHHQTLRQLLHRSVG